MQAVRERAIAQIETAPQIRLAVFDLLRESEVERTLKIKQCKTRTKTHKYPLILTQYEKNPETRNCFQTMTLDVRMSYKLKT